MIRDKDHAKFAGKIASLFGAERARWASLLSKGRKLRQLDDFGWLLFLALEAEDIHGRLDHQIQGSVRARWICWAAFNHPYWNFFRLDNILADRDLLPAILGLGADAQARLSAWVRDNPPAVARDKFQSPLNSDLETRVFESFCVAEGVIGYERFPPASVESLARVVGSLPKELITSFSHQASVAAVQALGTMWSLSGAVNSTESVEIWYGKHWTELLRKANLREVAGAHSLSPNLQLPDPSKQREDEYREILLKMRGGSHA